ncbi:Membrane-spanning 4-domains subfamily A member 14 [Frankliniella fusca]|uniref:Membrane-spanning 4-domains subfamily A member 14 n=1 Tax=Frankliniella fusca TaxID=407009 RepID=A0AAE1L9E8_9NEOP|nr:Membrane-spanning 4-domains subfamily A member 14 [Frankliniella fusca]KAK3917173.1 Membrane-spanning 4-domains subfamily A member 14 [Frankliniella fusca]
MPLIRVTSENRQAFKLVVADNLKDLLSSAVLKFGLNGSDSDFKACLDDDGPDGGADVDCDELFQELLQDATNQKKRLSLVVLPVLSTWTGFQLEQSSPKSSPGSSLSLFSLISPIQCSSPSTVSPQQPLGTSSHCLMDGWTPLPMREICLALDPVVKLLEEPVDKQPRNLFKLKQEAVKVAYKNITSHILLSVKDYRRCVAVHYAKSVFYFNNGVYRPVFQQSINGVTCGDGLDDFALKVYNAVSYGKPSDSKKRRAKRVRADSNSDVDNPDEIVVSSCRNSVDYGCVAFNPPLCGNETPEGQEEKRCSLLTLTEDHSAEVLKLLKLTYPTQRSDIIACKPLQRIVTELFPRWPHFKYAINLLMHAKFLLGKDVLSVFSDQLSQKGKQICNFMEALALAECSSKQPAKLKRANKLSKIFETLDEACGQERTSIFLSTAVFPLLATYFHEDISFMIQVISSGSSEEEILTASKCSNGNPILVITGESIFDEQLCPYLIIQNKIIVKSVDLIQSLATYISSFFIFGYWYTKEIKCTIEFIQRFLLNINPEKGSKVPKRYTGNVNSKVVSLSNDLQSFTSPWAM